MRYNEIPVGTIFQFDFDKDTNWVYEKAGNDTIVCLQAPLACSSAVNKSYNVSSRLSGDVVHVIASESPIHREFVGEYEIIGNAYIAIAINIRDPKDFSCFQVNPNVNNKAFSNACAWARNSE